MGAGLAGGVALGAVGLYNLLPSMPSIGGMFDAAGRTATAPVIATLDGLKAGTRATATAFNQLDTPFTNTIAAPSMTTYAGQNDSHYSANTGSGGSFFDFGSRVDMMTTGTVGNNYAPGIF